MQIPVITAAGLIIPPILSWLWMIPLAIPSTNRNEVVENVEDESPKQDDTTTPSPPIVDSSANSTMDECV